jgi:hypothetical protein
MNCPKCNSRKFVETIAKELYFGGQNNLINKLDSVWKKELASNSNRGTKRMLLDIDGDYSLDDIKNLSVFITDSHFYAMRKTKNGYALIYDACDTRDLKEYVNRKNISLDIHYDSMVFVEVINEKEN